MKGRGWLCTVVVIFPVVDCPTLSFIMADGLEVKLAEFITSLVGGLLATTSTTG